MAGEQWRCHLLAEHAPRLRQSEQALEVRRRGPPLTILLRMTERPDPRAVHQVEEHRTQEARYLS